MEPAGPPKMLAFLSHGPFRRVFLAGGMQVFPIVHSPDSRSLIRESLSGGHRGLLSPGILSRQGGVPPDARDSGGCLRNAHLKLVPASDL